MPWPSRCRVLCEATQALLHLHTAFDPPIVHTNFCPSNILLGNHGIAKLIGTGSSSGSSQRCNAAHNVPYDAAASPVGYLDPLRILRRESAPTDDCYALGVTILVTLTGESAESVLGRGRLDALRTHAATHDKWLTDEPETWLADELLTATPPGMPEPWPAAVAARLRHVAVWLMEPVVAERMDVRRALRKLEAMHDALEFSEC